MTELFIYGDITDEKYPDADTSAKNFVARLNEIDDDEIALHVNSCGGDVYAALAVHNSLKNFSGNVTAYVDGIAASAASLIVCGADKIVMASNALMMIHLPATFMSGFYTANELDKARNMLISVETAIIDTYQSRLNRCASPLVGNVDLRAMLNSETWFNAADAVKWGFADEIAAPIDAAIDGNFLIVNSLKVDMKKFDESKIRRALEVKNMESKPADISEIRTREVNRIRSLMEHRGRNSATDSLIDLAVDKGLTVEEIQPYLDRAKNTPTNDFNAVIRDQMQSGAEKVQGFQPEIDPKRAQQAAILKFANGGN